MKLTASLSAFLLLMTSSASATTPADLLCKYGTVSYSHTDMIPHPNGCTEMQCQFGQVIAFWEACRDDNGKCHAVGAGFIDDEITYECQKSGTEEEPVYEIVRITPVYVGCDVDGGWYDHLEEFELSDGCRRYQCQNGDVRVIWQACDKSLDNECHDLGSWYRKDGVFYKCVRNDNAEDAYGIPLFEHTIISPQPNPNISCILGEIHYQNLDIFYASNGCNKRQCQSGPSPGYYRACKFYKDGGTCYWPNQMWKYQNKQYECEYLLDSNGALTDNVQAHTDDKSYLSCWLSEELYKHLDTMTVDNDCGLRQCQDGKVPYLKLACDHLGQCRTQNSLWTIEGVTYKCIVTSYNYRKVVRVDENGNFDEGTKPQPPELGSPPPYEGCPAVADIIFLIDASRSMSQETFGRELDFAVNVIDYFKLGPYDIKIGAVVFSTTAEKVFDLDAYDNREDLTNAIRNATFLRDKTRTDLALDLVLDQNMFGSEHGGRDEADDIIILMTDGDSDDSEVTFTAGDRVKDAGIDIITVGVGFLHPDELLGLSSRYENAFFAPTFDVLETLLSAVSRRACDSADVCADDPCEHFCDGTEEGYECTCQEGYEIDPEDPSKCIDINECAYTPNLPCQQLCENTEGSFHCSCENGYVMSQLNPTKCIDINECTSSSESPCEQQCTNLNGGYTCSCNEGFAVDPDDPSKCNVIEVCVTKADIILIFDSSSSIGLESYQKQFDFAKNLIRHFTIGDNDVLFGAIVFSYSAQILFQLNENKNYNELDEALTDITYMNSSTYTHVAFKYITWFNMFKDINGARDDAKDIIVLITDGDANRQSLTKKEADKLKDEDGVIILSIAIGPRVTMSKLQEIVSTPTDIVEASSYDELQVIQQRVASLACDCATPT